MRRIATLAGLMLASCGLMFMPAYAAPPSSQAAATGCPPRFVDLTTGSLLDEAAVTQSSSELSRAIDGDVYVLGFEKEPSGNIETYLDNLYATCSDLQSADGSLRGNVMVFAFAMTPDTVAIVDIGEDYYDDVTESEQNHINDDLLWEGVHNADPTAGVVDAQKAMQLALTQDESAGVNQTDTDPWPEPSDGFVTFLKWAGIVIAVLIGLVFGGTWFVSMRRRKAETEQELAEAKRMAKEVADQASNLSQSLNFNDTELLLGELRLRAVGIDLTNLEALYNEAHACYAAATTADAEWNDVSTELDPEKELNLEQCQQVISMNSNTVQLVNSATEAIGAFDKAGKALLASIANPTEALLKLRQRAASLQADASVLETPGTETFDQVSSAFTQAERLIGSGKNVEAVMQLNTASTLLDGIDARHDLLRAVREEQARIEREAEQRRIDEEERSRYQPPPVIEAAPRPRRRSNPANTGIRIPRPRINWPSGGGGFGGGGGSKPSRSRSTPKASAPRRSLIRRSGGGPRRSSRRG